MSPDHLKRNESELAALRHDAEAGRDGPVLMLNLNTYKAEAGFPDGAPYRAYMDALAALLQVSGGRILWRHPVLGQMVGEPEAFHEALGIWYPSGQAFLSQPTMPGAEESYRLRAQCVERATIHRCGAAERPLDAHKALVRTFFAALANGELPDALLTDDMIGWSTTQGTMSKASYQNVIGLLGRMVAEPLTFTIDAITAEDDRALAEVRSAGRLVDGTGYANTYVFAFRFREGRICSIAEHFNALVVQDTMIPLMAKLNGAPA
ncbi:nuclear transport factor 2 family protein [Novosphingobium sp. M1R2S20]|uniref:Nuclear transport factor 2 family protein n=1 Tax=Novosphingobium rhizovicinum TaxID=3228928 RepID=A0ABV3RC12_9SPHN